jgi:hypothetical protein
MISAAVPLKAGAEEFGADKRLGPIDDVLGRVLGRDVSTPAVGSIRPCRRHRARQICNGPRDRVGAASRTGWWASSARNGPQFEPGSHFL